MTKLRVFGAFRYFQNGVKIHHAFIEPVRIAPQYGRGVVSAGVQFAAQQGSIDLRRGVTGDEFRIFQSEKVSEETAGDIRNVAYRLRAAANPRGGAQASETGPAQLLSGVE